MALGLQNQSFFPRAQFHPLSTLCPFLARASFKVCNQSSCTASQAQRNSTLGFMLCCCHLEILNTSWTRNHAFSFCTGPWKLVDSPDLALRIPTQRKTCWEGQTLLKHLLGFVFWQGCGVSCLGAGQVLTTSRWYISLLPRAPCQYFWNTVEINTYWMIRKFQALFWALFVYLSCNPHNCPARQEPSLRHFKDEEMDSQRVQVICLKSNSDAVNSKTRSFNHWTIQLDYKRKMCSPFHWQ